MRLSGNTDETAIRLPAVSSISRKAFRPADSFARVMQASRKSELNKIESVSGRGRSTYSSYSGRFGSFQNQRVEWCPVQSKSCGQELRVSGGNDLPMQRNATHDAPHVIDTRTRTLYGQDEKQTKTELWPAKSCDSSVTTCRERSGSGLSRTFSISESSSRNVYTSNRMHPKSSSSSTNTPKGISTEANHSEDIQQYKADCDAVTQLQGACVKKVTQLEDRNGTAANLRGCENRTKSEGICVEASRDGVCDTKNREGRLIEAKGFRVQPTQNHRPSKTLHLHHRPHFGVTCVMRTSSTFMYSASSYESSVTHRNNVHSVSTKEWSLSRTSRFNRAVASSRLLGCVKTLTSAKQQHHLNRHDISPRSNLMRQSRISQFMWRRGETNNISKHNYNVKAPDPPKHFKGAASDSSVSSIHDRLHQNNLVKGEDSSASTACGTSDTSGSSGKNSPTKRNSGKGKSRFRPQWRFVNNVMNIDRWLKDHPEGFVLLREKDQDARCRAKQWNL